METNDSGRIVVGVRATHAGFQAIRYAVAEARRRGVPLVAVHAYHCGSSGYAVGLSTALADAAGAEIRRAFVGALGAMPTDVTLTGVVREGAAGVVLSEIADRPDDVIVIGGSGARRFIGTRRAAVARDCSRRAACPVVIVPPPAMARTAPESRLAHDAALGIEAYLETVVASRGGATPSAR